MNTEEDSLFEKILSLLDEYTHCQLKMQMLNRKILSSEVLAKMCSAEEDSVIATNKLVKFLTDNNVPLSINDFIQ